MSTKRSTSTAVFSTSTKTCIQPQLSPCCPEATFAWYSVHPAAAQGAVRQCLMAPMPQPGGWNRFSIEVSDLDALVENLRRSGAHFRNDIVTGVGGKQILLDDPSGNPIELFEPTLPEASLER